MPTRNLTLEEFLQLPETKPASEYIDGHIFQKPMPGAAHSVVQGDLLSAINSQLRETQKGFALSELQCTFNNFAIVPDIAVLSWERIPRNEAGKLTGNFLAAPDWMIEILSPGQNQTKLVKKILHALEHGTQMGWLIDPAEDCVFGYTPDLRAVLYETADQPLLIPDFAKDFQLTVGELVAWLYE